MHGYVLKPQIHFNDVSHSWLACGPLQVIWKVPGRRPIVHWTLPFKPFLFG